LQLAELLREDGPPSSKRVLRVFDLCTGSGCISLLLHSLLSQRYSDIQILGLDISDLALKLARDNLRHNINLGHLDVHAEQQVSFGKADILRGEFHKEGLGQGLLPWDVVISNPPYISQGGFDTNAERSVRNWEPKLALVAPIVEERNPAVRNAEDVFYYNILNIADVVTARIVLMEVGNTEQALRVSSIAAGMEKWSSVEIWRDWPDQRGDKFEQTLVGKTIIRMRGSGHGRSVVCRK
jgi:methylase of polypeptide subunit release factors